MNDVFYLFGSVLRKIGKIVAAEHPVSVDPRISLVKDIVSNVFQTLEEEYGEKTVTGNEEKTTE